MIEGEDRTPLDLPLLRLPLKQADSLELAGAKAVIPKEAGFCRLFLLQGSLVTGTLVVVNAKTVAIDSDTFRRISVARRRSRARG